MTSYTIHFRNPERADASPLDPCETVAAGDLVARIDELSGRSIGHYIATVPLHRTGRAFVAGSRDGVSMWVRRNG